MKVPEMLTQSQILESTSYLSPSSPGDFSTHFDGIALVFSFFKPIIMYFIAQIIYSLQLAIAHKMY